jgi:hypothetical protein
MSTKMLYTGNEIFLVVICLNTFCFANFFQKMSVYVEKDLAFAIFEEMIEQTIIPEKIFIIIVVEKSVHN